MAYYVLEYRYGDQETRSRVRPAHLDYLTRLSEKGNVVLAGPVGTGEGAMVVYRAEDDAEVRRLVEQDPYTVEGVSVDASPREWNVVIPGQS